MSSQRGNVESLGCILSIRRRTCAHQLACILRLLCAVLAFRDTVLAAETCEELFTPQAPHIDLALAGLYVLQNGCAARLAAARICSLLRLLTLILALAGGRSSWPQRWLCGSRARASCCPFRASHVQLACQAEAACASLCLTHAHLLQAWRSSATAAARTTSCAS